MQNLIASVNRVYLATVSLIVLAPQVFASDALIFSTKDGPIRGADPVAFFSLEAGAKAVTGTDKFTYEWSGATWKFSSAENRDLFAANPEKYAPQYGGYCAYAVSHNFTKTTKPDIWEIVDGKLYLNYNRIASRRWVKDRAASIVRADTNWPEVLNECDKFKRKRCRTAD